MCFYNDHFTSVPCFSASEIGVGCQLGRCLHHPALLWQAGFHLSTWFNTSLAFKLETGAVERFLIFGKHLLDKLPCFPENMT